MSLKKIFNVLKDEGIVVPRLNKYLLSISEDSDRGHGWNSPSGVSTCPLSQFFVRNHFGKDGIVEPRVRRIFDNGHHVHERLQTYLRDEGILILEETPVYSPKLQIIGHCDGMIQINKLTIGIIELKSINSNAFSHLTGAKPEHQEQAQVYMMCLEELRERLNEAKDNEQFGEIKVKILAEYAKFMKTFVVEGSKYSKEEKITHNLEVMSNTIDILYSCTKRIDTMSVIYENKDNQELKEFIIKWDEDLVKSIKAKYEYINKMVKNNTQPPRPEEAKNKSCQFCRYCNFQLTCWR